MCECVCTFCVRGCAVHARVKCVPVSFCECLLVAFSVCVYLGVHVCAVCVCVAVWVCSCSIPVGVREPVCARVDECVQSVHLCACVYVCVQISAFV